MSRQVESSPLSANDNLLPDAIEEADDPELIHALRSAALGHRSDRKNSRNAQLAFDSSVALETRLHVIAELSSEPPAPRGTMGFKGAITWLPIILGILAVMALGAMLASKLSEKPASGPTHQNASTSKAKR